MLGFRLLYPWSLHESEGERVSELSSRIQPVHRLAFYQDTPSMSRTSLANWYGGRSFEARFQFSCMDPIPQSWAANLKTSPLSTYGPTTFAHSDSRPSAKATVFPQSRAS